MTRITPKSVDTEIDAGAITFYDATGTSIGSVLDLMPQNVVHIRPSGGDDTKQVQQAVNSGSPIVVAPGAYSVNNVTISASNVRLWSYGTVYGTSADPVSFTKNANGPMFTVTGNGCEFHNIALEGNGGTYTGVGIDVQHGDFRFIGGRILSTSSYCIDFTTADNTARAVIALCKLSRSDASPGNTAIRLAPDTVTATDKLIQGVTVAGDLLDTNSSQTCVVTGCTFQNIVFQTNSKKMIVVGNRMATLGADTTVKGDNHVIVGNAHAGRFVVSTSATSCLVGPNLTVTASVDNSTAGNNVLVDTFGHSRLVVTATSAPPDASLAAGQLSYWFDSTAGAARVMFKAKDAGGTVRSASLAMA